MLDESEGSILQIKIDEGYEAEPYKCTAGYWTVGFGHRITDEELKVYPLDHEHWRNTAHHNGYFYTDVKESIITCQKLLGDLYDTLPYGVKGVLINMAFNLGYNRLSKFKNMLEAVRRHDYRTAAIEMVKSKWYGQVKGRAVRLVKIMREAQ